MLSYLWSNGRLTHIVKFQHSSWFGCHKPKVEEHTAEQGFKELLIGGDAAWLESKRIKERISSGGNTLSKATKPRIAS